MKEMEIKKWLEVLNNKNKYDRLLKSFINYKKVGLSIIARNRGDIMETCLTNAKAKNTGSHIKSDGDGLIICGEVVEIKYISVSTGASSQMQGTICNNTLCAFNNGEKIEFRLINTSDLQGKENNSGRKRGERLTYDLNHSKGKLIATYTIENGLQGAIA